MHTVCVRCLNRLTQTDRYLQSNPGINRWLNTQSSIPELKSHTQMKTNTLTKRRSKSLHDEKADVLTPFMDIAFVDGWHTP